MTIQTAVLIETLHELGAEVHLEQLQYLLHAGSRRRGDRRRRTFPVYAWKGETNEEFDWCIEQTLFFPDGQPLNMILDDGGDLTAMVHDKYPELLAEHSRHLRGNHDRRASALPHAAAWRR